MNFGRWFGNRGAQRGNALLEFALVLPFLLLLMVGTIELGRYAYFSILVSNAALAAVQYGSQNTSTAIDPSGMAAAAAADVGPNPIATITPNPAPTFVYGCWDTSNASLATPFPAVTTATLGCPVATQTPVPYVTVTMTGTVNPLFHVPFMPTSITVTKTAYMRVQCTTGC